MAGPLNPLSVRNNNPGNMRPVGALSGFQSFNSPQAGIDAMRQDLLLKIAGNSRAMAANYGQNYQPTLANLINTWAPPVENDTNSYLNFVSQRTGIAPDAVLQMQDVDRIIPAMIEQEGGKQAVEYFAGNEDEWVDEEVTVEDEWVDDDWIDAPPELNAAQTLQNENPLLRTAGRGARNIAGGLAGLADIGLLVPKTLAAGGEFLLEKTGNEGSALEKFAQQVRTTPSMRDSSLGLIDQVTGNTLQPQGAIEKTADFVSELIVPTGSATKLTQGSQAAKTLKAKDVQRMTADEIRKQSSKMYKQAQEVGGSLKPEAVNRFIDDVTTSIKPQDELAQAIDKDDPANAVLDILNKMGRDQEMSLDRLQAVDEAISKQIDKFVELGKPKKEAMGLIKIQDSLREMVSNAGVDDVVGSKGGFEALKEGRKLWSRSAKLADVERIITRAEMSEQPANAIKSGFRTLYNNPQRMRGFSKEEKAAIKKAAESGVIGELLRGPASRLTGIISGATGGVPGYLAGKGTEMASRQLGAQLQLNRANALADLVAYGSKPPKTSALAKIGNRPSSVVFLNAAQTASRKKQEN